VPRPTDRPLEDRPPDIAKLLRGRDFRRAVQAMAALRHLDPASAAHLVDSITVKARDPQRDFQLLIARVIAAGGVQGLARRWAELPSPEWRETLISEIGHGLYLWVDEGTVLLLIEALDDADHRVARHAVTPLVECLRNRTAEERTEAAKTAIGRASLEALNRTAGWLTPVRRARIAQIVAATLARSVDDPKALTWPVRYIRLLGLTATRGDAGAIALLERFRPKAGPTHSRTFEKLDRDNLPWPTSVLADRKGIRPGTPMGRIAYVPTGLLDLEVLEEAIARVRGDPADHE
jgi:hypothetical protein